ncbi:hypothetical protein Dsin_015113 [Dipteronia sinensis]|uniref:Uncharacterized protein n=1 Tax=Dipteronia sinensis TaxID=43782 RepID=A0AAE0AN64_9ROSI|nr:hypothetical protein Dsin_015113 [Dipteronia sinensis]
MLVLPSTDSFTIQVNAMNKKGETAMDLNNRFSCLSSWQIGHILQKAGGHEAFALVQQQPLPYGDNENFSVEVLADKTRPIGYFLNIHWVGFRRNFQRPGFLSHR